MMWGTAYFILTALQPTDVCAVHGGAVPVGTQVEVAGRLISDVHFVGMGAADGSCQVGLQLSDDALNSPLGRRYLEASRDVAFSGPNTVPMFRLEVRGTIEQADSEEDWAWHVIVVDQVVSLSMVEGVQ